MNRKLVVAISGASGTIYGIRLLKALLNMPMNIYLVISDAGYKVLKHESGYDGGAATASFINFLESQGTEFHKDARLNLYEADDLFAPPASGSFRHDGMIVAPCSMKTLGAIVSGISDNLIHRAADVCVKERRPLILVTRETPLSPIHLKNMYEASIVGVTIMPPCPGFYAHPKTINELTDFFIGRLLDQLDIDHKLSKRWGDKDCGM